MGPEQNSDPDLKAAMDQARSHLSGGRPERAEKIYRKILESDPDHPDAHGNLGFALHAQGRLDEAVDSYSRAVALKSGWAGLHYNLGAALRQLGRLEEAVASHQAALAADPANGDAQTSLAGVFKDLGRFDEAAASFNLALEIDPVSALTHYNFANLLKGMGRLEEAIDRYGSALGIDGDFHQAHSNLGLALQEAGRLGEAAASYRSALDLEPGSAEVHYNLGTVCKDQDKLDEAVACYQSSLALKSDFLDAHINLGNALQHLGQLDEAMASYRAALEIDPASFEAGSNLLYVMLNVPGLTPEQLFDEHRRILADQLQGIAPIAEPFTNDQTAGRKLRIGYLTSDFRIHPVGSMILSLFEFHDRAKFEIFCYAQVTNPDAMTEQFRAGADHWHVVVGMGDAELAQLMRRHGIDLLVSLAGLTDDNRPLVCAHRAAPVQVSYLDGKSSALDEMDYWLSDGFLHPLDTTEKFTETIYRLPHFLQWPPPGDAPPVAGLPADKSGTISFGSFNNPAKVTTKAIDLWAEILNSVAGSRLVFKYKGLFEQASLADRLARRFATHGIGRDRLEFLAMSPTFMEHLQSMGNVDIALDSFPFNGATTTFQVLWMGVPVVTLNGGSFVSRMTGSILHPLGLDEWAVDRPEDYRACAIDLAGDLGRLRNLRAGLRERLAASSVCGARAHTRTMEAAYEDMWLNWCKKI